MRNKYKIKKLIKIVVPKKIISGASRVSRLFIYRDYDSTEYWKKRATAAGQEAVLWKNEKYNSLYREVQEKILRKYISGMRRGERILDVGAGIGIVSNMLCEINEGVFVDAVDFNEMVKVAEKNIKFDRIKLISSSAEEFIQAEYKYDLILSSACYSMIRNIGALEASLQNAVDMLADGGVILMIDPFHRWNYLARAKYGSTDVISFMRRRNLKIIEKSGVLFWPFRGWLSGAEINDQKLEKSFLFGEKILNIMGDHFWADYKILAFKK